MITPQRVRTHTTACSRPWRDRIFFTPESYQAAGKLLERAIALDPAYPQAYAYLAWRLNFRIGEGWSENPEADRARALVVSQRAIELDNEDPFVLAVGGHILSFIGRRPAEAIDLFDQALALNQNSAFAWGVSALTLRLLVVGRSGGPSPERLAAQSI